MPAVFIVAGGLTLILSLFALALGGDTGPTTMDLAVLASWVGLAIALVAGGVGFALGKRWGYWIGMSGVLVASAVYPWSLLESSHSLPSDSSVAIGPGSVAPHDAAAYYSVFLASLVVALIVVGFRAQLGPFACHTRDHLHGNQLFRTSSRWGAGLWTSAGRDE